MFHTHTHTHTESNLIIYFFGIKKSVMKEVRELNVKILKFDQNKIHKRSLVYELLN